MGFITACVYTHYENNEVTAYVNTFDGDTIKKYSLFEFFDYVFKNEIKCYCNDLDLAYNWFINNYDKFEHYKDIKVIGDFNKCVSIRIKRKCGIINMRMVTIMRYKALENEKEAEVYYYDVLSNLFELLGQYDYKGVKVMSIFLNYLKDNEINTFPTFKNKLDRKGRQCCIINHRMEREEIINICGNNSIKDMQEYINGGLNVFKNDKLNKTLDNVIVLDYNKFYVNAFKNCKIPDYSKPSRVIYHFRKKEFNNFNELYNYIDYIESGYRDIKFDKFNRDEKLLFFNLKIKCEPKYNIDVYDLIDGVLSIKCSEYELENIERFYNIESFIIEDYYVFNIVTDEKTQEIIRNFNFLDMVDKDKITPDVKSLNNHLYGKFGQEFYHTDIDVINGKVDFLENYETTFLFYYVSIIDYARSLLGQDIINNIDRFVYCDTDSLHLLSNNYDVIDKFENKIGVEVGQLKIEHIMKKVRYFGHKEYVYKMSGYLSGVFAGCLIQELSDELLNGEIKFCGYSLIFYNIKGILIKGLTPYKIDNVKNKDKFRTKHNENMLGRECNEFIKKLGDDYVKRLIRKMMLSRKKEDATIPKNALLLEEYEKEKKG